MPDSQSDSNVKKTNAVPLDRSTLVCEAGERGASRTCCLTQTNENWSNLRDWDCQAWVLLAEAETNSKRKIEIDRREWEEWRGKKEKAVRAGMEIGSSVSEHRARCSSVKKKRRQQQHQQHIMMSKIQGITRLGSITNWNPLNYAECIPQHVWRGSWTRLALLGGSNWFHCARQDQSIPIKVI